MSIRRFAGIVPGFKANARIDSMEVGLDTISSHTSSYDTIDFNVVNWDTGGWYDDTNYNWTPNVSGLYLGNINLRFGASETWYMSLYDVTGDAHILNKQRLGGSIASNGGSWQWQWWLEAGNAYDMRLHTTNASSVTANTNSRLWVTGPLVT